MRKIGYCRVSSREQAENSKALEQQIERVKAAGAEEIFVDVESGYKSKRRPQLEKLLELVRDRSITEVIITRLDRLSRKGVQSFTIFEDFLTSGVCLRALDEPFDLTTPSGRMTAGVLVVVAQHHSDQKAESVRYGWKHLRSRRVAMNPPFGYKKVDDKHCLDKLPFLCLIDEQREYSKAEIARDIIETFFKQQTLRLALREVNQKYGIQTFAHDKAGRVSQAIFRFSPSGLRDWLLNPVLQGHLCYLPKGKREIYHNTHASEKLISTEEVLQIRQILEHNKRLKKWSGTKKYPLSGLVFCGECRSACYSLKGNRGKTPGYNYYYQCRNWRSRACGNKRTVRMEIIESAVVDTLIERAHAIAAIAQIPDEYLEPPELQQLRKQLAGLEQLGLNPALEAAKTDLRRQIETIQALLQQQSHVQTGNHDLLLAHFSDPLFWQTLFPEEKQQVYRQLIQRVVVKDGQVEQVIPKV